MSPEACTARSIRSCSPGVTRRFQLRRGVAAKRNSPGESEPTETGRRWLSGCQELRRLISPEIGQGGGGYGSAECPIELADQQGAVIDQNWQRRLKLTPDDMMAGIQILMSEQIEEVVRAQAWSASRPATSTPGLDESFLCRRFLGGGASAARDLPASSAPPWGLMRMETMLGLWLPWPVELRVVVAVD